jgi:hypothetical protein
LPVEYATIDRVAGEKGVNQREKEGFARLEPVEEGADRSVRGEETGPDLAAGGGECGEALARRWGRATGSVLGILECTVRVLR